MALPAAVVGAGVNAYGHISDFLPLVALMSRELLFPSRVKKQYSF